MGYTGLPRRPTDSKRTSWIFHPPGNWPQPPDGWEPPPGWQPDPAWPPAPDGWKFWVPQRHRRGLSFYVKAGAGFITFVATVAAAYFGFRSQPATFTTSDWVRQANASCDQDVGALRLSFFDGLLPASATTAGQTSSSAQRLTTTTQDWIAEEGILSTQVGHLSAIQTPHDARARLIPAVLSTGNTLAARMDDFAAGIQSYIDGKISLTQASAEEVQNGDHVLTALRAWQEALQPLGLTHCAWYSSNPATTPATLAPSPVTSSSPVAPPAGSPALSPAEEQLASQLNPGDLANCTGRPAAETNGITAALNCQTIAAGPTLRPLVVQFSSTTAAASWFSGETSGFMDRDDCVDGYKLGSWTHEGVLAGPLGCAYVSNGDFRMVWIIDSSLVGVIADGTSGQVMTEWWDSWCYVIGGG
jgi:hypothetical protein